jgi:hypothetical protein
MIHVLFPSEAPQESANLHAVVAEPRLGGFFYDFLLSGDGDVVGVRYWMDDISTIARHPVFGNFVGDARFSFNSNGGYVDIVFNSDLAEALTRGELRVETVQEFGGDEVVKAGKWLGIAFDVPDQTSH